LYDTVQKFTLCAHLLWSAWAMYQVTVRVPISSVADPKLFISDRDPDLDPTCRVNSDPDPCPRNVREMFIFRFGMYT